MHMHDKQVMADSSESWATAVYDEDLDGSRRHHAGEPMAD
jgi:hypothetical protein